MNLNQLRIVWILLLITPIGCSLSEPKMSQREKNSTKNSAEPTETDSQDSTREQQIDEQSNNQEQSESVESPSETPPAPVTDDTNTDGMVSNPLPENFPDYLELAAPCAAPYDTNLDIIGGMSNEFDVNIYNWNHSNNPEYAIGNSNLGSDPSCGGENTLSVNLVRKLDNWDQMHVNGLMFVGSLIYDNFGALSCTFKINSDKLSLPSSEELETYAQTIADMGFEIKGSDLHQGGPTIRIRIRQDETFESIYFLNLPDNTPLDTWLTMSIAANQFSAKGVDPNQPLNVVEMVAETSTGQTVRHVISGQAGGENFPSLGIEEKQIVISLSLRHCAITP